MDNDDTEDGSRNKKRRRRKPLSAHYRANNQGGFGNPPVGRQFPINNPGGPGRPKGITNLEAALRKRLGKKLTVSKDGKSVNMTPFEVYAERMLEAILSKNTSPAMLDYGFRLLTRFSSNEAERGPDYSVFSDDELMLFGGLLVRALGEDPTEGYQSPFGEQYNRPLEGTYRVTRGRDRHIIVERIGDAAEPDISIRLLGGPSGR
jgi:hypothetical protein